MSATQKIFILGAGAIGLTLAAYLTSEGRQVMVVRTSRNDVVAGKIIITMHSGAETALQVPVETISLSQLVKLDGIVALTAKSYANQAIAATLRNKEVNGPLVIMQNGIGVEAPFLDSQFTQIYRCVLFATAQMLMENEVMFRSIASSPIGVIKGLELNSEEHISTLTTNGFPFHWERNTQREIWKKTIINAVFNSICPLLEIDNGVFARDKAMAKLAEEIVDECILLTKAAGLALTQSELMNQIMRISQGSDGVLISTLQDIQAGRETEIEFLNLEMARIASVMNPEINLAKTKLLGNLILAKSRLRCLLIN